MTIAGSGVGHEASPESTHKNKTPAAAVEADWSTPASTPAEAGTRPIMPAEEPQPGSGTPAADDQEASDLALALLMQEQERAHFLLANGGYGQWGEDGAGAVDEEEEEPDQPAFGPEDTSDEALAWRLMQEEQQQFNARLMNMARAQFEGAQQEEEEYGDEAEDGDAVDDPLANAPDVENMTYENLLALGDIAGHVSRGASETALKAIRTSTYDDKTAAAEGEAEQCTVCRMEFEKGEEISVLPCNHFYHPDCITQWMKINKACPICNTDVEDK